MHYISIIVQQLFSGIVFTLSIIITGYVGFLFAKKRIDKQLTANLTEEELKKELERNNQILISTLGHYSGFKKEIYNVQIDSIKIIWQAFINLKKTIPPSIFHSLMICRKEEFDWSWFNEMKLINNLSEEIETSDFAFKYSHQVSNIYIEIENIRYALNEDLYSLWRAYLAILTRVVFMFAENIRNNKIYCWQEDIEVDNNIRNFFDKKEMTFIYMKDKKGGFGEVMELFSLKAINNINKRLSGKEEVEDLVGHINRLRNLNLSFLTTRSR